MVLLFLASVVFPLQANVKDLSGKQMPEIGPTVTFSDDAQVRFADLKGKACLIIFFQSWWGPCNKWSVGLFKQLTEKYGNRDDVALIALKTDGSDAEDYMSKRCDTSKWLVGNDVGGKYYETVMGEQKLWLYSIVDPSGKVVESAQYCGKYYDQGGKQVFSLPKDDKLGSVVDKNYVGFLPKDKKYPESLSVILKAIKFNQIATAIKELRSLKGKAKTEGVTLLADIDESLKKRVEACKKRLADTGDKARIVAYDELVKITTYKGVKALSLAKAAVAEAKKDSSLKNEIKAHKSYMSLQSKIEKANMKGKPIESKKLHKSYQSIAKRYPDTYYGKLAAKFRW